MIIAAELGGLFAAHAIWSLSEGEGFIPMLAYTNEAGEKSLKRLALDDTAAAVDLGKAELEANPMDANDAALLFDARITVAVGKLDALIVELRAYFSPDAQVTIAIPYTPASTGDFKVHKPRLLEWTNCDDFEVGDVFEAFFQGVAGHEKGSAIWDRCLDESK